MKFSVIDRVVIIVSMLEFISVFKSEVPKSKTVIIFCILLSILIYQTDRILIFQSVYLYLVSDLNGALITVKKSACLLTLGESISNKIS